MIKLLMEYYHRRKANGSIAVSWKNTNVFLEYRVILWRYTIGLILLTLLIFFLLMVAGSTTFILISTLLILFMLIKIGIFFRKIRKFFESNYQIDVMLLDVLITNDFSNEAVLVYKEKDGASLIEISAIKGSDMHLNSMLDNLDSTLEAALALPLIAKSTTPQKIIFLFGVEKPLEQWIFKREDMTHALLSSIPLDVVPLSDVVAFSLSKSSMLGLYGRTGSGKTVALQWYLYLAIAKGAGTDPNSLLSIIDGKGADLQALGELTKDNLHGNVSVGSSPNQLAKLSREFVETMNVRYELIQKQGKLNADAYDLGMTPNFLFVDELASIKDECGTTKEGKALWNEILGYLGLIAKKGRQAGCSLVISTQDPNAENIPSEIRLQISSVLFLGTPSADRLRMAFSMCDLENVPAVPTSKGGGLFYADGLGLNEPIPVIAPFVDVETKSDFVEIINRIAPDINKFI